MVAAPVASSVTVTSLANGVGSVVSSMVKMA